MQQTADGPDRAARSKDALCVPAPNNQLVLYKPVYVHLHSCLLPRLAFTRFNDLYLVVNMELLTTITDATFIEFKCL